MLTLVTTDFITKYSKAQWPKTTIYNVHESCGSGIRTEQNEDDLYAPHCHGPQLNSPQDES